MTDLDPIAVLARIDPAAGLTVPPRPDLDELTALPGAGPGGPPSPRTGPVVLVAAAALVVVVAVAWVAAGRSPQDEPIVRPAATVPPTTTPTTVGGPDRPTPSDPFLGRPVPTPLGSPEPAADALAALALRVGADTAPIPDGVAYARGVGWMAAPDGTGEAGFQGTQTEVWSVPGEPTTFRQGVVSMTAAGADRRGDPGVPPPSLTVDLGVGTVDAPSTWERSGSVDTVRDELLEASGQFTAAEAALTNLTRILSFPTTGPARDVALRALAGVDGVQHRGVVVDRLGRPAVAFSAAVVREGMAAEVVVLLDTGTAELLASETVYLGEGPVLVAQALTTVETGWVDEVGERP